MTLLPATGGAGGSVACANFTVLNDSVALEGLEEFGVSFRLLAETGPEEGVRLNNGRAVLLVGSHEANVVITDDTGMLDGSGRH